jgi:hypothetical protein
MAMYTKRRGRPFPAHELAEKPKAGRDAHRHIEQERPVTGDDHADGFTLPILA